MTAYQNKGRITNHIVNQKQGVRRNRKNESVSRKCKARGGENNGKEKGIKHQHRPK
jgi:hypothetical protein